MDDIRDMIAAERTQLAEMLDGLPAPRWDRADAVRRWRAREVVAHITMPSPDSSRRFMLRAGEVTGQVRNARTADVRPPRRGGLVGAGS